MQNLKLDSLTYSEKRELLRLLEERNRRAERRKFFRFFPDSGPLRRELYPQHIKFFACGAEYSTRAFMAANRVGKTEGGGGYELVCHLTGLYPKWWPGYRFSRAIDCWIAGDTKETVRDITQRKLFGPPEAIGTGLIPGDNIIKITYRQNAGGAIDTATIRSKWGISRLGLKSYDQGRTSFQGTEKDVIWLDEEAPPDVRGECVLRLMTTKGLLIETFTPLKGITDVVKMYVQSAEMKGDRVIAKDGRVMINAGWDDVPHLDAEEKERMLAETLPHLREARSKGIPSLGSGAIYPVQEIDITVSDFEIRAHWPRVFAMDVGWNRTAGIWGAHDRESDIVYLYSEYYRGQAEPIIHAEGFRARGVWIPGVIDPASHGRAQDDGKQLIRLYKELGLELYDADNDVESGLLDVWQRLSTGKLKVFKSCQNWLSEYRIYRRDEKGKIVKENDHLMDATRYLIRSGLKKARMLEVKPNTVMGFGLLDEVAGY